MSSAITTNNGAQETAPEKESLLLEEGIVAKLWRDQNRVTVYNRDWDELFSFGANACPFEVEPVKFLLGFYKLGYARGVSSGREVVRMRLRELLKTEL